MLIRFLLIFCICLPVNAEDIYLEAGRISLIDFGSLITSEAQIVDQGLVRAYKISGLEDEDSSSVLALQGLKDNGETDLTINTSSGYYQFRIFLNDEKTTDICLKPNNSRLRIYSEEFKLNLERSSVVSLPRYINQRVLVGDPDLLQVSQFLNYYDDNFLKLISITSSKNQGKTDLVIPSQSGIYKLSIDINKEGEHVANINLI